MNPSTVASHTDPVAWLEHDHQIVRRHLEQLRTTPAANRQPLLDELKKLLALHNAIEENLVYPAIAKVAGEADRAFALYHQTAEADMLLYSVSRAALALDEAAFAQSLAELTAGILEHVEVEETQAFPRLQSAPPAELHMLAQQIIAFRTQFTVTTP